MKGTAALLLAVAAALLAGCAGWPAAPAPRLGGVRPLPTPPTPPAPPTPTAPAVPATPSAPPGPPFAALAVRLTDRALEQVRAGDLRMARDLWSVVAALRPGAEEPKRQVEELSTRLAAAAEGHYRDGVALLQEGKKDAARRELLLALAAEPDHAAALDVLKNRLEPDAVTVTVAPGETFESIAKRHYGDSGKATLLARINGLDPGVSPAPGTELSVPVLALPAGNAEKRAAETAGAGKAAGASYDTDPAAIGTEAVAPEPPAPAPPAPPEAPVPPRVAEEPSQRAKERAEELYKEGVRFFINQDLDAAIQSWERALALNPAHPNAAKDIEKAHELQRKLKELR